uniref:Uncharacterized protein n=1 Tax=Neisseria meningitidis alpha275 TaxID=295996 RepID=C6SK73_NEIME|nr:hypothetical protein predicted by Glimmer/Critica [Neisseria meningitidis alpha275]
MEYNPTLSIFNPQAVRLPYFRRHFPVIRHDRKIP